MSENVGLPTPRGSGTSGYVQKNHAFLRPRNRGSGAPYPPLQAGGGEDTKPFRQRQPDKQILEHDRRREIEVRVMEERERLEELADSGEKELDDEEIEKRCEDMRQRLLREMEEETKDGERDARAGKGKGRGLKSYQVHELAEAKIEESERLRKALGIKEDRETGEISSSRDGGGWRARD